MSRQLTLDGREVEHPPAGHHLTYRQGELVAWLALHGPLRASSVPTHRNPWAALRRLEALGLAARGMDGRWRAVLHWERW